MEKITSRKNPLVTHLKKLGASRAYRYERGEFLCDGEKLLREAVSCGAEVTAALTESAALPSELPGLPFSFAGEGLLDFVSPLKNAQDVIFSCRMPVWQASDGRRILLDGIQDPGNLGAILRTARAFQTACVFLTGECADPYNPKAVRASMGAVFRQPVIALSLAELRAMVDGGVTLYGAALGEASRDIRETVLKNAALAVGSEGRGLSEEVLALCAEKIVIPMSVGTESLNAAAAAAILLWEASKTEL
ncbi:MAG: RNA methyltransferase [Oscillospiraceae bacterium]|jgi:TrmH family RNA methyltransferase|nr:RNA methyltransferase [Oscillospiraceae bacterium]